MRIFTSIFTVAVAASIAFAAPKTVKPCEFSLNSRNSAPKAEMLSKSQRASVVGATVNGRAFMGKNVDRISSFRAAPARHRATTTYPEVIEETPEGTPFVYARKGDGFMSFYGYIIEHEQNGQLMNAVFGADGKTVYIQDPISSAIAFTWVKGTFDGTKITVPVGQYIMYSPEEGYGAAVYAGKLTVVEEDGDSFYTYMIDESIKEITYNVAADGTVTLEDKFSSTEEFPEYVVTAFFDDDLSWSGYSDYNSSYTRFDDTATELPAGVEAADWMLRYYDPEDEETKVTFVSVGLDGDKMYVGNLSPDLKDAYITGTVQGDKVSFPSNQYLGISNIVYLTYFVGGEYSVEKYDDDFGEYVEVIGTAKENLVLDIDANSRTLKGAENEAIFTNPGKADTVTGDGIIYFTAYPAPELSEYNEVAATPATPEVLAAEDLFEDFGCVEIMLDVPAVSTTGEYLNTNKLYYQIYIRVGDEIEPFVFYSDEYPGLEDFGMEEMTEIPYTMTLTGPEGDDITYAGEEVYFYTTLADAYGVKSIYKGAGEVRESPISWYDINGTTGVKDVVTDGQAKVTAIYGADGMLRSGKTRGLNIVKMSDGSVRKVIVR